MKGYINVDLVEDRSGVKPDVNCDLRNLSVFESDYADEILSVHVVEHFWRWEVEQVLSEWVRVLKPGGKLILECPNLISACEEFLKDPEAGASPNQKGQRTMWVFYGDPRWRDPLDGTSMGLHSKKPRCIVAQLWANGTETRASAIQIKRTQRYAYYWYKTVILE